MSLFCYFVHTNVNKEAASLSLCGVSELDIAARGYLEFYRLYKNNTKI
jgi:hypothetical protein